jgi:hypothetical protein
MEKPTDESKAYALRKLSQRRLGVHPIVIIVPVCIGVMIFGLLTLKRCIS